MLNIRQAGDHLYGKLLFTWLSLVMSDGVFWRCPFSHEMSWTRSGIELRQFLSVFLPTLMYLMMSIGRYNSNSNNNKC